MSPKTERFAARVSPETLALLEQAAHARGVSTSAFVLEAAEDAARQVVARMDITWVSKEFYEELMANPDEPDPWPELERLAKRPPLATFTDQ